MSLDMSTLRAKLDRFKGQNKRSDSFWRPKEGRNIVRIVPWAERPENPFIEIYFHYLGNRPRLSPKTYGKPDPLEEFADHILDTADDRKEAWQKAKEFKAKLRTHVPVIVRGEEDQGVRYYAFGKTVFTELLSIINDPDYGDITDPETGRDITVIYTPREKSDTNFAKTSIRPKPNQTSLSEDSELVDEWLNEQPDIHGLFTLPSYEELEGFLRNHLNPDENASVTTETLSPPTNEDSDEDDDTEIEMQNLDADDDSDDDDEDEKDVVNATADEFEKMFSN